MLVPKLRFKREDGTDYPEWEQTSLEDVCDIVGGGTPSTKNIDYWNGNIQWFTPSEIGKTKYVSKSVRTISQVGFEKSSARKLPVGTILLTSRATLGEMAIATIECTTNQGFQSLIPRRINGEYLYYLQPTIKNYCNKKACGSTFNEISKGELGKCKIPMPHFEEQQKIADFLSALDEVITQSEAEVQNLEQQKKSAMQKIFSQELRFKREDGTEYPEWEENAISDLFEVSAGGDINKANSRKEYGEDYPYAVYANALTNRGLYGYANYYKIGCDCFTVTGRGDVGYAIARHEKFVPIVRLLVCIPKHNENVDCFAEIVNYTNVFVDNTGVPQLTSIQLGKIRVAYPTDIEEQQKIADFLSALDEAISYAKQELDKWKELKKGLLQQMFV